MADLKISALTGASTPLTGTEVLPIVQSGATVKVAVSDLTAGRAVSAASVTASTGNFVIGTSGQGIDFSATPGTGTSELLADYEEGTWTVELYDAQTGGNVSPTSWTGYYTKVGRQVTVSWTTTSGIDTTGMTGVVGLYISLPFTASSTGAATGSVITRNVSFTLFDYITPYVPASSARAALRKVVSAGTDSIVFVPDFTSGTARLFYFSLTYFV